MLTLHVLSCIWIYIGANNEGTWITASSGIGKDTADYTLYITSFYWVVTTLTTIGYGDYKGFTTNEYMYTMFVEFAGIAFFSFIMGSINNVFFSDDDLDMIEEQLERVNIWLVKLDNSRMEKTLPEVLYIAIGNFIKESLSYDHKKLISGFEFLEQLKPSLRSRLVHELFPKFFKEFEHLFEFELAICGKEFMAYFVTKLYCRLFMGNQIIIKKGDYFEEMYMIF
jgi:Ion channel